MEVRPMRRLTRFGIAVAMTVALVLAAGCGRDPWWTDPSVTWITTYGGEHSDVGEGILPAEDGGCFIVGTSDLRFGAEPQGDIYLIRTDAAHASVWERTYGGDGRQMGQSIIPAGDGAVVMAGSSSSSTDSGADVLLLAVDRDGSELWSATLGGPLDEMVSEVLQTDRGFFLVGNLVDPDDTVADSGMAGYGGYDGRSSIFLTETDPKGNELWTRIYDDGANVLVSSAVSAPDGGIIVLSTVTYFPDSDDDLRLLRVDEHGDEVWTRTWSEGRSAGRDLIATSDGNFLIAGSHAPSDDTDRSEEDFLFIKVDPDGNEIWASRFGDPGMIDYADAVIETADGNYVAVGDRTKDFFSRSEDLLLVKIDEEGKLLWERTFPTATHNMFGGLFQHADGGYVIAGSTVMSDDAFDVFLIKTDSEGRAE